MKKDTFKEGQSLVELLISLGIFGIAIVGLGLLVIESYASNRLSQEITKAVFLAEEGMEATRSIRDNSWDDLAEGSHGLTISDNHWVFSGTEEDLSGQLKEGKRKIIVESIDVDRKKITSEVTWQFTKERIQKVKLVSYLTNWAKVLPSFIIQSRYRWRNDDGGQ